MGTLLFNSGHTIDTLLNNSVRVGYHGSLLTVVLLYKRSFARPCFSFGKEQQVVAIKAGKAHWLWLASGARGPQFESARAYHSLAFSSLHLQNNRLMYKCV